MPSQERSRHFKLWEDKGLCLRESNNSEVWIWAYITHDCNSLALRSRTLGRRVFAFCVTEILKQKLVPDKEHPTAFLFRTSWESKCIPLTFSKQWKDCARLNHQLQTRNQKHVWSSFFMMEEIQGGGSYRCAESFLMYGHICLNTSY